MKTIIAGSRTLGAGYLTDALAACPWTEQITAVISGCAAGIDTQGEIWARMTGLPIRRFPADWQQHGRAAGMIRNQEMVKEAEALLAVWDGLSSGTGGMIKIAKARGLLVHVHLIALADSVPPRRAVRSAQPKLSFYDE